MPDIKWQFRSVGNAKITIVGRLWVQAYHYFYCLVKQYNFFSALFNN